MSVHSARGRAWDEQRLRVLERDDWQCTYCKVELVRDDPATTVDHVEAIALDPGRTYLDDELVAACRPCNSRKGARELVRLDYRAQGWFS